MSDVQLDHSAHKASSKKYPICFLAHDIDVPMNIGSFFRIADALGVERIYLTGRSVVPPNAKIKKTSRSTEKYVPHTYEEDPFPLLDKLKGAGYTIVSLEITSNSIDIADFEVPEGEKICLVLGAENEGICAGILELSDLTVHIPMLGINSSMNVAAACAIATYEIARRFEHGCQAES